VTWRPSCMFSLLPQDCTAPSLQTTSENAAPQAAAVHRDTRATGVGCGASLQWPSPNCPKRLLPMPHS
jgi:hypothetical protein